MAKKRQKLISRMYNVREDQDKWLKEKTKPGKSASAIIRELIDVEMNRWRDDRK